MENGKTNRQLAAEVEALRSRLEEAEETLRAITNNEVDALVVQGAEGQQIFTLQGAEQPYRTLMETMSEGALTVTTDGTILYCNSRLSEMIGRSLNNLLGVPFNDFVTSRDGQSFESMLHACGIKGCRAEFFLKTDDGGKVPVSLSVRPLMLNEVEAFCIVATDLTDQMRAQEALEKTRDHLEERVAERTTELSQEISDRKRMEDALRRSRDELEQRVKERTAEVFRQANLLELTHDAIFVRNAESRITYWNKGAQEMYGWSRDEALGRISQDLLKTKFPKPVETIEAEAYTKGRWEGELVQTARDGSLVTVASRWTVQTDNGTPVGILETNNNITEQKNTEQQLRQAQKLEALGTLSGGIAHDFNNLLAAIIGFTELVHDHLPKESRERHHTRRVLEASMRGRELVRQMLTFSRRTEGEKKPLRLSAIVKETGQLLRSSIPSTIDLRINVIRESGVILGTPVEIQQVVMNLATNAAFAMREKGGTLDIELSDFSVSTHNGNADGMEPGLYMRLVVRDTGTGIPAEVMDRIFDPFFTTKGQGEGTGLGLSVVMGIVTQCHGYIKVESMPGKGSTFSVYFPKVEQEPANWPVAGQEAISTGDETILFVDDEEALVEMGEEILAELGYEVICRTSSGEALALFKQDPSRIDLVITDQTMPDMTGVEVAREMLSIRPDLPIILATGFSHIVDAKSAQTEGIKGFVMKPLTRREIAKTIRKVLDEQKQE